MVLKKNRQPSDNILFIDASQNYEKATNQNYLRDEDLEAIIGAVEKREFVDKFAYVASFKEIANENDFNLNIPRYVDTFEEHTSVDLSAISKSICRVEKEMEHVNETIASFCNELGIEAPANV